MFLFEAPKRKDQPVTTRNAARRRPCPLELGRSRGALARRKRFSPRAREHGREREDLVGLALEAPREFPRPEGCQTLGSGPNPSFDTLHRLRVEGRPTSRAMMTSTRLAFRSVAVAADAGTVGIGGGWTPMPHVVAFGFLACASRAAGDRIFATRPWASSGHAALTACDI
jgi:hypothetical protein